MGHVVSFISDGINKNSIPIGFKDKSLLGVFFFLTDTRDLVIVGIAADNGQAIQPCESENGLWSLSNGSTRQIFMGKATFRTLSHHRST